MSKGSLAFAIYVRRPDGDFDALDAEAARLARAVRPQACLVETYVDPYEDGRGRGPALQRLIAEADRFDVVAVAAMNQLGVNLADVQEMYRLFLRAGVKIIVAGATWVVDVGRRAA